MTKQTAIRKFCLECADGHKGVALCTDPSCALWPFRLGCGPKSSRAKEIMAVIKANYPKDVAGLSEYGLDADVFFPPDKSYNAKKLTKSTFGRPARETAVRMAKDEI